MIRLDDIRNPARASGFDYVTYAPTSWPDAPYRAQVPGRLSHTGRQYALSPRVAGVQAAQDYVNYVNGQGQRAPSFTPRRPGAKSWRLSSQPDEPSLPERLARAARQVRLDAAPDDLYVVVGLDREGRFITKVGRGRNFRPNDAWFPGFRPEHAYELTGAGELERALQAYLAPASKIPPEGEYFYGYLAAAAAANWMLLAGGHELEEGA